MDQDRINFGNRLKDGREARAYSVKDVARVTKIPERTIERLEAGQFELLPAEVFVRGFVRSYARAVGLDAEDMARRYGELVHGMPAKPEPSLADAMRQAVPKLTTSQRRTAAGSSAPPVAAEKIVVEDRTAGAAASEATAAGADAAAVSDGTAAPAKKKTLLDTDELKNLSRALLDAGRETRRMPLTVAVIILVIVATVTMSLLLRRPSHVGDGISSIAVESNRA